ncbi:MAG: Nramp family divalent metal transporter [Gemmatimonadetes bacterium]|nr:Nramp family divalent metal transporter [Gemmatimonadota bacterium]
MRPNAIRRLWRALGPGVVTGAADDDPSGITTYSIAGAQFGTSLLWTALITWPLMAAVQSMCARIGMVTGKGLTAALRHRFPRPLLVVASFALLVANTINIGADLSGMADAAELLSGVGSHVWVVIFAVAIGWATISLRYAAVARALKWLALALFAYVIAALRIGPDWGPVLRDTFTPRIPGGRDGWAMLVAILGTTISPYLFYWQTSQEVEEEKLGGRASEASRRGATPDELTNRRWDVGLGTLFSNVAMYFIILTTALTLHRAGITQPQSSREVAQALEPLAGRFSALLYTVGLVGTGVLAIPTLAGSAAYALAELFGWREGIDERFRGAPAFYTVFGLSLAAGVALDFAHVNPLRALFWTAVINGVLAPFLLVGILIAASDRTLMRGQPSLVITRVVVALAMLLMFGAAGAMFLL